MSHLTRTIIALILSVVCLSIPIGCASLEHSVEQITQIRDNAVEIRDEVSSELDEATLLRESIPDTSADADPLDALIAQLTTQLSAIDTAILHADQIITESQTPSAPLTIAADTLTPWVPAPLQAPMVLGAALVTTLVRSRSIQSNARSIVESIDHAMRKDETFKSAFNNNADTIRTIQTPGARRSIQRWIN